MGGKDCREILLYIPNLIGYARLCLLILAYFSIAQPGTFVILYCLSISLDFFDGWAARKFNQSSSFGAWWGWIVVSIEWITFVGNHKAGSKWREENANATPEKASNPPKFVQMIMANGFKTPIGTWVILGLHCLPVWIYAMQTGLADIFISYYLSVIVCILLVGGRLLCLACELWCVKKYIIELLEQDIDASS